MTYAGIVFDKDGTLLDFNRTWLPIYRFAASEFAPEDDRLALELLSRHGFDPQRERFMGGSLLAAGNNREIAAAWAEQLQQSERVDDFDSRLRDIFREQGAMQATPVNGLSATLQSLRRRGLRLGVATADSYEGILNTLRAFDVLDEFDFLAGYDSGHGVKPGGGMVVAFCEQVGISSEQVIVVGDNRHDIEMGRNANAGLCIGVLTGTSERADLEDLADVVLDDIRALPDYLASTTTGNSPGSPHSLHEPS